KPSPPFTFPVPSGINFDRHPAGEPPMGVEQKDLADLYPLDSLRPETLAQLASEAALAEYARGETLFRAGDLDSDTVYLLEGEVSGEYPDGRVKKVSSGSLQGRYPIGDSQ